MKLLNTIQAQKLSEDELRELVKERTGKTVPLSIKKKGLVALVSGKLNAIEEKKVFSGKQPDELDMNDVRRFTDNDLRKMGRSMYGFNIPKSLSLANLEKMVQGKLKPSDLSTSQLKDIGRENMEMAAFFGAQFGLDKVKGLDKLHKSAVEKRGIQLAKRFQMKRYSASRFN